MTLDSIRRTLRRIDAMLGTGPLAPAAPTLISYTVRTVQMSVIQLVAKIKAPAAPADVTKHILHLTIDGHEQPTQEKPVGAEFDVTLNHGSTAIVGFQAVDDLNQASAVGTLLSFTADKPAPPAPGKPEIIGIERVGA